MKSTLFHHLFCNVKRIVCALILHLLITFVLIILGFLARFYKINDNEYVEIRFNVQNMSVFGPASNFSAVGVSLRERRKSTPQYTK